MNTVLNAFDEIISPIQFKQHALELFQMDHQ